MFENYQIRFRKRSKGNQILNVTLTLIAGILTLIYPNFLYLIIGGYLIALGIFFLISKLPTPVVALPIVAGLIIILLPELIPFTFATFLIIFGAVMFLLFRLLGILSILTAVLILMNPDLVAYFAAFFMLTYAISELVGYYKAHQEKEGEYHNWEEVE